MLTHYLYLNYRNYFPPTIIYEANADEVENHNRKDQELTEKIEKLVQEIEQLKQTMPSSLDEKKNLL